MSDLEDRLFLAVNEPDSDLELLAHEVAASEDAQAYLMGLISTLRALSPDDEVADRAAALLEHGIAIEAEHGMENAEGVKIGAQVKRKMARDPGDGERG
jgi:hypothetical protein